ncbi:hypothetical protein [Microbacterium sp. ABRD28]|uniref:alcohol dehydrogenase catalytic domain-containing protein n=1 Tax=Microbacterium sp. ABRD28 TaxID=2268461 RepID=UPI0023E85D38|nr:hypothetical protein [Microbacterium sp. ABRD28]
MAEPRRIGTDGAGVITAVGPDVDGFRVGDPVVVFGATGAYATDIAVPVRSAQPRPASVTAAEGAALGIPVATAYQALRSLGVRDGDTLLVHAGSGAVGQAAIQLATLWGARVIATLVRGRDTAGYGIRAFSGGAPTPLTPQQRAWRAEAIPVALALLAAEAFSVELGPSFALGDAAAAHRAVEQGAAGKVILLP